MQRARLEKKAVPAKELPERTGDKKRSRQPLHLGLPASVAPFQSPYSVTPSAFRHNCFGHLEHSYNNTYSGGCQGNWRHQKQGQRHCQPKNYRHQEKHLFLSEFFGHLCPSGPLIHFDVLLRYRLPIFRYSSSLAPSRITVSVPTSSGLLRSPR